MLTGSEELFVLQRCCTRSPNAVLVSQVQCALKYDPPHQALDSSLARSGTCKSLCQRGLLSNRLLHSGSHKGECLQSLGSSELEQQEPAPTSRLEHCSTQAVAGPDGECRFDWPPRCPGQMRNGYAVQPKKVPHCLISGISSEASSAQSTFLRQHPQ